MRETSAMSHFDFINKVGNFISTVLRRDVKLSVKINFSLMKRSVGKLSYDRRVLRVSESNQALLTAPIVAAPYSLLVSIHYLECPPKAQSRFVYYTVHSVYTVLYSLLYGTKRTTCLQNEAYERTYTWCCKNTTLSTDL